MAELYGNLSVSKFPISGTLTVGQQMQGTLTGLQSFSGSLTRISNIGGVLSNPFGLRAIISLPKIITIGDVVRYNGSYQVTPSTEQQTLDTSNKYLEADVVVEQIQSYETSNAYGTTFYIG